jgi:hypothetical protein
MELLVVGRMHRSPYPAPQRVTLRVGSARGVPSDAASSFVVVVRIAALVVVCVWAVGQRLSQWERTGVLGCVERCFRVLGRCSADAAVANGREAAAQRDPDTSGTAVSLSGTACIAVDGVRCA